MTAMTLFRGCTAVVAVAAALLTPHVRTSAALSAQEPVRQSAPGTGTAKPLFEPATRTARAPMSGLAKYALRHTTLTISEKALASGVILNAQAHILDLFPDVQIVTMRSRVESRFDGDYSWFGYIPGDEFGRVVITVVRGKLGAMISHKSGKYVVLPGADGLHDVFEMDPRSAPEGNDVVRGRKPQQAYGGNPPQRPRSAGAVPTQAVDVGGMFRAVPWNFDLTDVDSPVFGPVEDDGSVIDIMVAFTHQAALETDPTHHDGTSGMGPSDPNALLTLIQLAIDEANQSLVDSGVQFRLNMIPFEPWELEFQESGDLETDLDTLPATSLAISMRKYYAADLVALVVSDADPKWCGMQDGEDAFLVVKNSCLDDFTLAHEVGHAFFLQHDWWTYTHREGFAVPSAWPGVNDGHGHVQFASWEEGLTTIMSYYDKCDVYGVECRRVGRWSNPNDVTQNGQSLGIPQGLPYPANDARQLNLVRHYVANLFRSACRMLAGC